MILVFLKLAGAWLLAGLQGLWRLVCEYPRATAAVVAVLALWWGHNHLVDLEVKAAVKAALAENNAAWQGREDLARAEFEATIQKKRQEVADLVLRQQEINAQWQTVYNRVNADRAAALARRIEEVPRYVTPLADSRCIVPAGFLLHTARAIDAANGKPGVGRQDPAEAVPQETLGLVDRPSGVSLSAVDAWVQRLIDAGKGWRDRALMCDRWVDEQATAHNQQPP